MSANAFLVGRTPGTIASPFTGKLQVFASQLLDDKTIEDASYEHCTFANVSFKSALLKSARFTNCVFISCYFRKTDFRNASFSACRFIDCEFPDASFSGCELRYARFTGCYIDFAELEHSLPQEPNLRQALAHNLAREAARLGDSEPAKTYRLAEVAAREEHLWRAFRGSSKWYREHYDWQRRFGALVQLTLSRLNGLLFGYGERPTTLLRTYLLGTFVVFPFLFYFASRGAAASPAATPMTLLDTISFSFHNATAGAFATPVTPHTLAARLLAGLENVCVAIWASVLASYFFRWSLHR